MTDSTNFARNLVKGKIAETVFAQMLRETGKFTVLAFGYEKILPELVGSDAVDDETLEVIKRSPDFAVINDESKEVKLIEVKYQKYLSEEYTLKHAKRMQDAWNPSYLFILTHDGFYFDNVEDIIEQEGEISELDHPYISEQMKDKYLQILNDFET
jgi:membrane protease subunit (stomatin/prohibitin family)